ncbi:MAG: ATP-binding cassette domain-containing protein [Planctomycetes bacterium]|nr:ATP-binding cassette domain-containing protein [Planctomycetota bacterium]
MIEVEGLTKYYGPVRALNGIAFRIETGEIVGLLGPNGAGKSTAIKIMTTFLAPDAGRVAIEGHDVAKNPLEVRRLLGYLPEDNPLYTDMKVLDYLRFMAQARQLPIARWDERMQHVVQRCGLSGVLKKTIGTLSKGFRQRVGLAQALIHDPRILILDEPTSGLDPNQILEIRGLIQEVGRDRTVILSTHILQEVAALASRAVVIHRGEIRADGTLESLARQGAQGHYVTRIRGERSNVEAALRADPAVGQVEALPEPGSDSLVTYRIVPKDPAAEIGERIFEAVKKGGFTLARLEPVRPSLEQVFHQLTMTS